jgi:hypothetical protein
MNLPSGERKGPVIIPCPSVPIGRGAKSSEAVGAAVKVAVDVLGECISVAVALGNIVGKGVWVAARVALGGEADGVALAAALHAANPNTRTAIPVNSHAHFDMLCPSL